MESIKIEPIEKSELTITQEFALLSEQIEHDLLTQEQEDKLLSNPTEFLKDRLNSDERVDALIKQIVKSYFVVLTEMRQAKRDTKKQLSNRILMALESRLTDTDSLTVVDLSQIHKNLNQG